MDKVSQNWSNLTIFLAKDPLKYVLTCTFFNSARKVEPEELLYYLKCHRNWSKYLPSLSKIRTDWRALVKKSECLDLSDFRKDWSL